jgi:hypothetical protein
MRRGHCHSAEQAEARAATGAQRDGLRRHHAGWSERDHVGHAPQRFHVDCVPAGPGNAVSTYHHDHVCTSDNDDHAGSHYHVYRVANHVYHHHGAASDHDAGADDNDDNAIAYHSEASHFGASAHLCAEARDASPNDDSCAHCGETDHPALGCRRRANERSAVWDELHLCADNDSDHLIAGSDHLRARHNGCSDHYIVARDHLRSRHNGCSDHGSVYAIAGDHRSVCHHSCSDHGGNHSAAGIASPGRDDRSPLSRGIFHGQRHQHNRRGHFSSALDVCN